MPDITRTPDQPPLAAVLVTRYRMVDSAVLHVCFAWLFVRVWFQRFSACAPAVERFSVDGHNVARFKCSIALFAASPSEAAHLQKPALAMAMKAKAMKKGTTTRAKKISTFAKAMTAKAMKAKAAKKATTQAKGMKAKAMKKPAKAKPTSTKAMGASEASDAESDWDKPCGCCKKDRDFRGWAGYDEDGHLICHACWAGWDEHGNLICHSKRSCVGNAIERRRPAALSSV